MHVKRFVAAGTVEERMLELRKQSSGLLATAKEDTDAMAVPTVGASDETAGGNGGKGKGKSKASEEAQAVAITLRGMHSERHAVKSSESRGAIPLTPHL